MAGPIRIAILANGRQARSEAALTARAYGVMGRKVGSAGKLIAGAFAIGSLIRVAGAVERVGGAYVGSLNKIQALTGANEKQLDRAADNIERRSGIFAKMGQTAGDAAGGIVELTKSGLSLNASLKAVRATMTLAKAGELEVADASELVANTLNTFSLKAKDASRIANGLANAANISSADVSDLAESFKYVSPLAAKAGVSLDQTNAILAELANSGIKASQAGTSFRSFLLSLQAPVPAAADALKKLNVSVYDAQGNMRPLSSLIDQLSGSLGKLNQEDQNVALKTIFGKVGITGAQVILKNGTKVLDQYTKGVKRAGAAQKLANAASKGLDGTLQSLKASTVSTTQELFRRFSPALDARLSSLADYLAANKDQMIETGVAAARRLGPALSTLAELAKSTGTTLKDSAVPIAKVVVPALELAAKTAEGVVSAFNDLPGPLKSVAVQAGVAALVLPRLFAAVGSVGTAFTVAQAKVLQFNAEMTYTATRAQLVSAAMTRLSAAARGAAGIGGLVLLSQASQQTNQSLGFLEKTAGGALTGFALGGPIGAAIGAGAGALYGLASATSAAAVEAVTAKDNTKAYVDTLDRLTGASTRATRARIFDRLMADKTTASLVTSATKAGAASRDIVSAVMGQGGAWTRLNGVLADAQKRYEGLKDPESARGRALAAQIFALQNLTPAIRAESSALASSIAATKAKAQAVVDWGHALKGVPPEVRAVLKNEDYDLTRRQVDDLAKRYDLLPAQKRTILNALGVAQAKTAAQQALAAYNRLPRRLQTEIREVGGGETTKRLKQISREYKLTPRQVRTLIQATGAKATVKDVGAVRRALADVGKTKPTTTPWLKGLTSAIGQGANAATRGSKGVRRGLELGPATAKADLSTLMSGIRTGSDRAAGVASAGGRRVGQGLKSGILSGFSGTLTALSNAAAAAVRAAVASARAAAKIHSPSQEMRDKVGKPLADGLVLGFLRGVQKGSAEVKSALDRLMGVIGDRLDGKKQAGRRKALLKSLKDERAELIANGKLQDKNAKRLDQATAKLKSRTKAAKEYAATIKAAAVSYGSVVGLGTTGGGTTVGLSALLSQLTARAGAVDKYNALIEKLSKGPKGLNQTTVQQLLDAGVEGGLATAEAIASGGQAAINQINQLTAHIASSGGKLGQEMRDRYKQAGIDAAQGMVDGLKKRQKALDKVAERLANALVSRVKKALGIHSPSKVFADIGRRSVQGLGIGLDETYVRRVGTRTAAALTTGFGTPALDAYMRQSSSGSSAPTFTVQIELTAQQLSEVEKGRKIQVSLDAYKSAGGRSRVKTS